MTEGGSNEQLENVESRVNVRCSSSLFFFKKKKSSWKIYGEIIY